MLSSAVSLCVCVCVCLCVSVSLLSRLLAVLNGELAFREGNCDAAWLSLRKAVALDDGLAYDEPWGNSAVCILYVMLCCARYM